MRQLVRSAALSLLVGAPAVAQDEGWLPAAVQDGLVQQLTARMAAKGFGIDAASRQQGAEELVEGVRVELEKLGASGLMEAAPAFAQLPIPSTGQQHLDAMARFQVCNLSLMLLHEDPAFDQDAEARQMAVSGLTAMTMAVLFLRQPFLEAGGEEAQIAELLGGEELGPILQGLKSDQPTRDRVDVECASVLDLLLAFQRL